MAPMKAVRIYTDGGPEVFRYENAPLPAPTAGVEEIFGWIKTVGNFRSTRYRAVERTKFRRLPGRRCLQPAEDRKALSQRMNRAASKPDLLGQPGNYPIDNPILT
jgi:hypothetical protein